MVKLVFKAHGETSFQSTRTWSCATSSSSSSLATSQRQDTLHTVNYLSQLLLTHPLHLAAHLLTVCTPSTQLHSSTDTRTICILHAKTKPLANTLSLTLLWSSGILALPRLSHLVLPCFKPALKTPLQSIPQLTFQTLSSSFCPPPPPTSFSPSFIHATFLPCTPAYVHMHVCICVVCKEYCYVSYFCSLHKHTLYVWHDSVKPHVLTLVGLMPHHRNYCCYDDCYKDTWIFIRQWHLNVHRNLSWWHSIHTNDTAH